MARYLLDTNLLIRFVDFEDPLHAVATDATLELLRRSDEPAISGQVLIELWAVATRPVSSNGLGWDLKKAEATLQNLLSRFTFLEDTGQVFQNWMQLMTTYGVSGKQVHDTRLVALMLSHGVSRLLTFNSSDFKRFAAIQALDPTTIVAP